jgi:hypothetical protein
VWSANDSHARSNASSRHRRCECLQIRAVSWNSNQSATFLVSRAIVIHAWQIVLTIELLESVRRACGWVSVCERRWIACICLANVSIATRHQVFALATCGQDRPVVVISTWCCGAQLQSAEDNNAQLSTLDQHSTPRRSAWSTRRWQRPPAALWPTSVTYVEC